jgi:putative protease
MFQSMKRGRICPGRCYSSSYFKIAHTKDSAGKNHFIGSASRGGSCHRICRAKWDLTSDSELMGQPDLKGTPELLLWEMPDYIRLGVNRFKIPGRERSVDLVADICAFYRRVLDHVLAGNDDVSQFEEEWNEVRDRWVSERGRRDEGRITRAQSMAIAP